MKTTLTTFAVIFLLTAFQTASALSPATPPVSQNSTFYFNSYLKNPKYPDRKIDLAFKAKDDPRARFNPNKKEHSFSSAYMSSMRAIVNIKNLLKWASERSAMIKKQAHKNKMGLGLHFNRL